MHLGRRIPAILSILLMVGACQTVDAEGWLGDGTTPFSRAQRTCESQTENIGDETARPAFFAGCMRALGWVPNPGTTPNV